MSTDRYVKSSVAQEMIGVSAQTLLRYAKGGLIETIKTDGGQYRYNADKYLRTKGAGCPEDNLKYVCYCRVSTHGQKSDLDRQVAYMSSKYPAYEIITDIGSGINFKRPGLKK